MVHYVFGCTHITSCAWTLLLQQTEISLFLWHLLVVHWFVGFFFYCLLRKRNKVLPTSLTTVIAALLPIPGRFCSYFLLRSNKMSNLQCFICFMQNLPIDNIWGICGPDQSAYVCKMTKVHPCPLVFGQPFSRHRICDDSAPYLCTFTMARIKAIFDQNW